MRYIPSMQTPNQDENGFGADMIPDEVVCPECGHIDCECPDDDGRQSDPAKDVLSWGGGWL